MLSTSLIDGSEKMYTIVSESDAFAGITKVVTEFLFSGKQSSDHLVSSVRSR